MDAAVHRVAEAKTGEFVSTRVSNERRQDQPDQLPEILSVSDGYRCWAPTYDEDMNPLLLREERCLLGILRSFTGKRMLDVACGTGRWLHKCVDLGIRCSAGIDISEPMLTIATRKPAINQRLVLGDCTALPFADCIFDLVICSFASWHIPNIHLLAQELARVTKSDGTVLVSDLHPEAYARGWRTGFRDSNGSKQIDAHPLTVTELISKFEIASLQCSKHEALRFGEPEMAAFARAGRMDLFEEAMDVPAVAVFQFRRLASGVEWKTA